MAWGVVGTYQYSGRGRVQAAITERLSWSRMIWHGHDTRRDIPDNQLRLAPTLRWRGGGVSRVMSSTPDTFCGCSECELASQIWPKCQPQGVPGVSNMAPGVSPMCPRYAKQEVFVWVRLWVLNWKDQDKTLKITQKDFSKKFSKEVLGIPNMARPDSLKKSTGCWIIIWPYEASDKEYKPKVSYQVKTSLKIKAVLISKFWTLFL